jgi:peptidoglycan DL-endopeptidase CwlO
VFPISPSWVRRYGRASALGLLAVGVLLGALTAAAPATATTQSRTRDSVPHAPTVTAAEFIRYAPVDTTRSHLRANRSSVSQGGAVTLRGKVMHGGATVRRDVVRLQARSGGAWKNIRHKHLSSTGVAAFTVWPQRTRHYRLAYPGGRTRAASVSSPTRIAVLPARPTAATSPTSSVATSVATGGGASASVAGVSGKRARVLAIAASLTGRPYSYGGAGPNAFDCSGFTQYVFRKVGISLPHQANAQKGRGVGVSRANARPGDLIIFLDGGYGYHVGIYAGGSYMYDSPRPGLRVGKHKIWTWNVVFRRVL